MDIKCIALDLDRTTLDARGRLSEANRVALEQAIDKGIHIVVASGRSFYTLPEEIRSFPGIEYAVTGNGAAMYHVPSGRCLHKYLIEPEDVLAIMKETERDAVSYEAFIDGTAYAGKEYIENPEAFGASPEAVEYVRTTRHLKEDIVSFIMEKKAELDSIDIIVNDENQKRDIWERVERRTNKVYITSSIRQLIEISHQNAGKHSGVAYFMDLLGLRREEVAAFGDGDNDVDMLLHVGHAIAMENASRRCKEAADYVTKRHDEDGVAYGMREILRVI
jgi:Cof subfamily protein (haloacid dehalogenase superfamily)